MLEVAVEPSLLIAGACALVDLGCTLLTMSSSLSFVFCKFTGGNPQLQLVADAGQKFMGGAKRPHESHGFLVCRACRPQGEREIGSNLFLNNLGG
jgi:hypothetical protein